MPGIPKVLLRLCRLGSKRGLNHPGSSQTCQKASHRGEVTKDLHGSAASASPKSDTSSSANGCGSAMTFPCVRRPLAFLEDKGDDVKLALILLNQPLESLREQLKLLWRRSVLKAAADGGSNRLYECMMGNHQKQSAGRPRTTYVDRICKDTGLLKEELYRLLWETGNCGEPLSGEYHPHKKNRYIPDLISGDFDSIRPEILLYYQKRGAKIIETPDQNYTDFTKCLRLVIETIDSNVLKVDAVVVLGAFGDRFDQTLSNVNTLYEANNLTKLPVYLLADRSLGCVLRPGKHAIEVNTGLEDSWCGLVPIGGKCHQVTTTGLKWNLDHQPLQFGGLISTSNTYAAGSEVVTVQTDQPLFWTMGFKDSPTNTSKNCHA